MKRTITTAALCASLVALPALSADAKPNGKGKGPDKAKSGERGKSEGKGKRCKKTHRVGFVAAGSLASVDASGVTLTVERANRHARRYLADNPATFSTDGARVVFKGVTDSNGNGVGFDDVTATDTVKVIGKLATPKKRCAGETTLKVRKLMVVREAAEDEDATEDEAPEGEEAPGTPDETAPAS